VFIKHVSGSPNSSTKIFLTYGPVTKKIEEKLNQKQD